MRRQTTRTITTTTPTPQTRVRVTADTRVAIPLSEWARDHSISPSLARKWAREGLEVAHPDGRRERLFLPVTHAGARTLIDRAAGDAYWAAIQVARAVVQPLGFARRASSSTDA